MLYADLDFKSRLGGSRVLEVIQCNIRVKGRTVLDDELFLVTSEHSQQVDVYKESRDHRYELTRHIKVAEMVDPWSLVSSHRHRCLYISDWSAKVVHRIDVGSGSCSKWSVEGKPMSLSVTRDDNNVLVTLCWVKRLEEYRTRGQLVTEIRLDESIDGVFHSV